MLGRSKDRVLKPGTKKLCGIEFYFSCAIEGFLKTHQKPNEDSSLVK